jgi:hypothetical protein
MEGFRDGKANLPKNNPYPLGKRHSDYWNGHDAGTKTKGKKTQ